MAVTHTLTGTAQSITSFSSPHTFTSLINLPNTTGISFVGVSLGCDNAVISGVTLGGQTVTLVGTVNSNNDTQGRIWLGRINNSLIGSTGNKNLVVTFTGSTLTALIAGVTVLDGHDTGTPIGTPVTGFGGTANGSISITDSATGDMVIAAGCLGTSITAMTQTERWRLNVNGSSAAGNAGVNTAAGAAGSVVMGMTHGTEFWGFAGVAVKQMATPNLTQSAYRFYTDTGTGLGEAA